MRVLILVLFALLFVSNELSAQKIMDQEKSPQELYDFHIKKNRTNNLAGWISLGGGVAATITGVALSGDDIVENIFNNDGKQAKFEEGWLIYVGVGATLASIPFFIASGKHKRKARLQLKNGAVGLDRRINYSGVSISFSF